MHLNTTTIGRRTSTVLVAAAAAVAVLAPVASAGVGSDPQNLRAAGAAELTPAEYVKYLEKQDDPEAKDALASFKALPKGDQAKFVDYLQDEDVFKAFTEEASGPGSDTPQSGTVTQYNSDIAFVNDAKVDRKPQSAPPVAHWNEKATYTAKIKVLGITVTKLQVWVRYQSTRAHVTKVYNSGSAVKNINAAVSIDSDNARPWKAGGYAHAETVWKGSLVYKGFGIRMDKKQKIRGEYNGAWTGSLKNA
ncbi:hypothetical protein GCM10010252_56550 [Streptomyces aureoverticillatus]|nr:hypothetical protein GCM10010252_56550 [Streptomyces aureoverticillatus]